MRNLWIYTCLLLAALTGLTGCKEIIAEDITGDTPVLYVPAANDTVQVNPVLFKWELLEGASKYRLQVVSPSFANISIFALDTIVTSTEFNFPLDSNVYELKLTALNGGYESQTLGPIKFWVGIAPTSSGSTVVLDEPAEDAFVNDDVDQFSWNALSGATSYEFSLRKGTSFETGQIIHTQNNVVTNVLTLPAGVTIVEGNYYWGVKAYLSDGTETVYTKRALQVDTTAPNTPVGPFMPTGNVNTNTVTFSWVNGNDGGTIHSPVTSLLEIASDSQFTNIVDQFEVSGSSQVVDVSGYAPGTYYWSVINTDEAGNQSNYSATTTITVN